ncbi:DUF4232 domain-containing protein [Acidithrix sp. C25]|uniref:DUF4232 domain-containing protein n=1 Tax=Acidithrix sp. C25 TaxID=1671482 RepID=UPI00191BA28F|nr:DUF4232 domain-containing protein [Acidithrix sp. C25]
MRLFKQIGTCWAVLSLGLLLGACGSSGQSATTTTIPPTTTSTTIPPTTTSTTIPPTTTTTKPKDVRVAGGRCVPSQLTITEGRPSVAAGSIGVSFSMTNSASTECYMQGYPGLEMLNSAGGSIPTYVHRGNSVSVISEPVTKVTLQSGQTAYFLLGYSDGTGYGSASCPTSASIEVTPPNDYGFNVVKAIINPYGGRTIANLQCGDVTVSPVIASLPPGY